MIWIVLPAYNEAASIGALLDKVQTMGPDLPGDFRVLVVDDGSADGTADVVRGHALGADGRAEVVAHEHNMGLGAAMRTGIDAFLDRSAPNDVMVSMDADDTHEPHFIMPLLQAVERGAGVAIASRFQPGGREIGVSLIRRIFSRGVRVFMRVVAPVPGVRDYSCGYRAYTRAALERGRAVFGDHLAESPHFSIMAELLVKLAAAGVRFEEVPFTLARRARALARRAARPAP